MDISYCNYCNRHFMSAASLIRHTAIYGSIHNFIFPCCKIPFTWTQKWSDHKCLQDRSLDKNQDYMKINDRFSCVYRCNNCDRTFNSYRTMKKHVIRFIDFHNFVCTACDKHFLTSDSLKKHLCILANGTFQCSCLQNFSTLKLFKQHAGLRRPYYCCRCHQKCITFNNLINHIRSHTKEKPFQCPLCTSQFRVRESLTTHLSQHKRQQNYNCSKCKYFAKSKWNLKLHERCHEERNPEFLCSQCGRRFNMKHHLRRHMRTHSEIDMHLCLYCGKTFSQLVYLQNHMNKHNATSDRGQKCPVCSKVLAKVEKYQHHRETGHFKFVCEQCCKVFSTKFNLKRHYRIHKLPTKQIELIK